MPDPTRTFEEFIRQMERVVSRKAPKVETVSEVKDLVTKALESPGWLPERCRQPALECYARHLLHHDREDRFSVVAMVWQQAQKTPIHDHGGYWCVEGVYEGRIRVTRYDLDEPVQDGIARLHHYGELEAGIGTTGALIPPVDYHTIANPYESMAVTVHTYGGDMKSCRVYLPLPDGSYEVRPKTLAYHSLPGPQTLPASSRA